MNDTPSISRPRLDAAWRHYWDGNHLAMSKVLGTLTPIVTQLHSQEAVEYWLLESHLFEVEHHYEYSNRALVWALREAHVNSDPLPTLAVHLHTLNHHLSKGDFAPAKTTLDLATDLSQTVLSDFHPNAQLLLGRLAYLHAVYSARTEGRAASIPHLVRADRHARILGKEHQFLGIAFGPINLKSDCTFLLLCFDDPKGAIRLSESFNPDTLSLLRRAYFMLDVAIAYATIGQHESEEYCYSQAARLVPHFRPSTAV